MQGHDSSNLHIGKNRQLFFDNPDGRAGSGYHPGRPHSQSGTRTADAGGQAVEQITYFALRTYYIVHDTQANGTAGMGIWNFDPVLFSKTRDLVRPQCIIPAAVLRSKRRRHPLGEGRCWVCTGRWE